MWLKACDKLSRQIYLSVVLTNCFYVSLDNYKRLLPADRMVLLL